MKIIFKHSYRCPVSCAAQRETEKFLSRIQPAVEIEWVDVIGDRARSHEVAAHYRLTHESPQILLLDDSDRLLWHASHSAITEERIHAEVSKHSA